LRSVSATGVPPFAKTALHSFPPPLQTEPAPLGFGLGNEIPATYSLFTIPYSLNIRWV